MLSNAGKGSQIGFSLIVGWFVGLCIALVLVSPSSPERLLILALVWLIVGLFASLVTRIVQIIGGVIALVSAVLIILEKVFTLL